MTTLSQKTLIVIADGEKALFLKNKTDHQNPLFEVIKKEEHSNPPSREQGTDKPGRMHDTGKGQRSALNETDWHKLEKQKFAADLAQMLYQRAHKGRYNTLVIAASPQILGELRGHLHKEVENKLIKEIPKTLTNHPLDTIEDIVKASFKET